VLGIENETTPCCTSTTEMRFSIHAGVRRQEPPPAPPSGSESNAPRQTRHDKLVQLGGMRRAARMSTTFKRNLRSKPNSGRLLHQSAHHVIEAH
jgi:hypothetical protein